MTKKRVLVSLLVLITFLAIFNADGSVSGIDFPISTPSESQLLPVIAHNTKDNQSLVVWQDDRNPATSADIYGRLVDANGSMDGGDFGISTSSADQTTPDVAYDSFANQYLVVWVQSADVYGRLVLANGTFAGPEFQIASGPGGLSDPTVGFDSNSKKFLVVWSDTEGWDNLYARLVDTSGVMAEPQFAFAFGKGEFFYPDVAFNPQTHQFLVVWRHETCHDFIGCDDNDIDIFGSLYDSTGGSSGVLPWFPISDIPYNQSRPSVAYNSSTNQYLVVWEDFRGNVGFGSEVYAQLVNSDGSMSGINIAVNTEDDWQRDPKPIVNPVTGRYLVVWEDWRNASDDIYGQQVNANGSLSGSEFTVSTGLNDQSNVEGVYHPATNQFMVVFDDDRLVAYDYDIFGTLVDIFFKSYLPVALRNFQPVPPPPPTATAPLPTATPVTPGPTPTPTPTNTPTPTDLPGGWVALVAEDFEGSSPLSSWDVFDDTPGSGEYYWGKRSCRSITGTYSGWAVGAGADGGPLPCSSLYPNNANSWMRYGPFSLADATDADLSFKAWVYSETNYDYFYWMASTDGTNFSGDGFSGDSGGWIDLVLDLTSVTGLGDLTGQPVVWIALIFQSDEGLVLSEGAHVDDILLRKCTTGGCTLASPDLPGAPANSLTSVPAVATIEAP
jgi:hypothetical protein